MVFLAKVGGRELGRERKRSGRFWGGEFILLGFNLDFIYIL